MLIGSVVDYGIHAYIEAVRYIFISKICFCALMVQIADSCCEVKIKNFIFVSFWYVLESDVSTNDHYFTCFIFHKTGPGRTRANFRKGQILAVVALDQHV